MNVEKQYQALCESWRVELEEKQRQFEQAKGQILGPRDLELMRVAMMDKVEAPLRAKCDLLARVSDLSSPSISLEQDEITAFWFWYMYVLVGWTRSFPYISPPCV